MSVLAVSTDHGYGSEALQSHLPPLRVAIPVAFWEMFWPDHSLTPTTALRTTTPFFGTVEDAVIVKLKTNVPVDGATAGRYSALWAQSGAARPKMVAQNNNEDSGWYIHLGS